MKLRTIDPKTMNIDKQIREARNAYARTWRAAHRDKVRQYNLNYWARKAAQNGETTAAEGR